MTRETERYAHLHAIFEEARGLTSAERRALLESRCGADSELRAEIEGLLDALEDQSPDALSEAGIAAGREQLEQLLKPVPGWMPQRIGSYHVERLLGQGGMGVVYEARQDSPSRRVALKVLRPEAATPQRLQRFRQEAELLGRLQHPGIAAIHEAGSYDLGQGVQPYFAMEFVEGLELTAHAKQQQLPLRARLELLAKVCDAVQYAHGQGVIHRDLKPENVLVDATGQPKVLDFGVARATEGSTVLTTLVTEEGDLLGTIAYMAPEQLDGRPELITVRSDVYGLGAIAFELLVGRLPHDLVGLPLTSALEIARSNEPPRLGTLRPELKGEVETVIGKALERDSARRYPSAAAFADDLRAVLEHRPISARPPSVCYRASKFVRRHKALVAGTVSTIAAIAIGLVASLVFALRSQRNAELAREGELKAQAGVLQATQDLLELDDLARAVSAYQRIAGRSAGWEVRLIESALPVVLPERLGIRFPGWATDELLLGSSDAGVELFELGTWKTIRELGPREPAICNFGNCLYESGVARRFDWRTGELLIQLERGEGDWVPVLFEDQNGVLRGVTSNPEAGGYTLFENGRRTHFVELDRRVYSPRFAPNGRWVVMLDGAGWMGIFETDSGALHGELNGLRVSSCNPVHFDPDSNVLVFDDLNRLVRVDPERVEVVQVFSAEVSYPCAIGDISDDGTLFAWNEGALVQVFDLVLDQVVYVEPANLGGHRVRVRFSPSARKLIVHAKDLGTRIIDMDDPPVDPRDLGTGADPRAIAFRAHVGAVEDFAVSPDGRLIASLAPQDPFLQVWDAGTAEPLAAYPKPVSEPTGEQLLRSRMVAFSADGQRLLASVREGAHLQVMVVELSTGAIRFEDVGEQSASSDLPLLDTFLDELGPTGRLRLGTSIVRTEGKSGSEDTGPGRRALVVQGEGSRVDEGESWSSFETSTDTRGLACSPDGTRVAVCRQRMVDVHRRSKGELLMRFRGTSSCVDWSPDGRLLAVGTPAGRIRLLDAEVGIELLSYKAHAAEVTSIAWVPDGSRLISASLDGDVRVWDPRSPVERLRGREGYEARLATLRRLAASELESRRASGASTEESWAMTRVVIERTAASRPAAAPAAEHLAGTVAGLRPSLTYDGHSSYVYALAVSPDGRLVASMAPAESELRVWDASSGETLLRVPKPRAGGSIENRSQLLLFSEDGRRLFATVRLELGPPRLLVVDLLTGELQGFSHTEGAIRSHLAWLDRLVDELGPDLPPRLGRMAVATPDGLVLASRQVQHARQPEGLRWSSVLRSEDAEGISLSPDGELIAMGGADSVALLDRRDQGVLASTPGQAYGVAWSPAGDRIAVGGEDGRIRLLDPESLAELGSFDAHGDYVFSLAWTPDGSRLVSCSGDGTVKVWDELALEDRCSEGKGFRARVEELRALTRAELVERFEAAATVAERGAIIRAALEGS